MSTTAQDAKTLKDTLELVKTLEKEIAELELESSKKAKDKLKIKQEELNLLKEEAGLKDEIEDYSDEIQKLEKGTNVIKKAQADNAKALGDNIQRQVESLPFIGEALSRQLDLQGLGLGLQKSVLGELDESGKGIKDNTFLQRLFNLVALKNPYTAIALAVLAVGVAIVSAGTAT